MISALFIVWRETFEAVLIVGILHSYLKRQENPARSLRFMWAGVFAGIALSAVLAYGIQMAQDELQGRALEYFQAGMLVVAAFLMTQMCVWMKRHSRKIKFELETGLREALTTTKLIGVASLAALAIAREGTELVMFFYGMGVEAAEKGSMPSLIAFSSGGIVLAGVTYWMLSHGLKAFNPKVFFRVTAVFLLVTASSLLLSAVRKLIQMDAIPTLKDQVWDTSFLLDERNPLGQVVSGMTGYQSGPALMTVLIYAAYWAFTFWFLFGVGGRLALRCKGLTARPVA